MASVGKLPRSLFFFPRFRVNPRPVGHKFVRSSTQMSSKSGSSFKYVVLGGGNAAGYAAQEFVKLGGEPGSLAVIGEEPYVSYERPALSKAYLFPEKPARLPGFHTCVGSGGDRQEPSWYESHDIAFLTGKKVTDVDFSGKVLTDASGDTISFEKLIIATGASPIKLSDFGTEGADLKGIYYLRNVDDADALIAALTEAKKSPKYGDKTKALCVGGGYIGMETAAGLALNDVEVTMVFPESRLLERLFTQDIAEFYEKYYASKGIKMIKKALVTGFKGDSGCVTHAQLKDGTELPCDIVVVGVGARPNLELFKGKLDLLEERPGGVKVDGNLMTSSPDVYAVGDIAAFPQKYRGGSLERQEHVQNARQSAAHAVAHMLGRDPGEYAYLPYFYSREFDLSWVFYGSNVGDVIHFGNFAEKKFGAFWVENDHVVGCFLEGGTPEDNNAVKTIAAARPKAPANLGEEGLKIAQKL